MGGEGVDNNVIGVGVGQTETEVEEEWKEEA